MSDFIEITDVDLIRCGIRKSEIVSFSSFGNMVEVVTKDPNRRHYWRMKGEEEATSLYLKIKKEMGA